MRQLRDTITGPRRRRSHRLGGDAVRVRMAVPEDGADLAQIYAPYVVDSVISFEVDPPDAQQMSARVAKVLPAHPWLVATEGGQVVGYAYGSPHSSRAAYRWSVDVSVYVRGGAHRRGIGRALYEDLFARLASQGYRRLFAGVTLPNAASVGLHESMGFVAVGVYRQVGWKFGAWHDVGWWQRPLPDDAGDPPPEPRPIVGP